MKVSDLEKARPEVIAYFDAREKHLEGLMESYSAFGSKCGENKEAHVRSFRYFQGRLDEIRTLRRILDKAADSKNIFGTKKETAVALVLKN